MNNLIISGGEDCKYKVEFSASMNSSSHKNSLVSFLSRFGIQWVDCCTTAKRLNIPSPVWHGHRMDRILPSVLTTLFVCATVLAYVEVASRSIRFDSIGSFVRSGVTPSKNQGTAVPSVYRGRAIVHS